MPQGIFNHLIKIFGYRSSSSDSDTLELESTRRHRARAIMALLFLMAIATSFDASSAYTPPTPHLQQRREALFRLLSPVIAAPAASLAVDVSALKLEGSNSAVDLNGVRLDNAKAPRSVFVGQWSDPNHPNGGRSITLSATQMLGFQLAVVELYNEAGQAPTALNALVGKVAGKQTITIDFTPVGGPAEFRGIFFPATGGLYANDRIEFPDGNAWTRRSSQ